MSLLDPSLSSYFHRRQTSHATVQTSINMHSRSVLSELCIAVPNSSKNESTLHLPLYRLFCAVLVRTIGCLVGPLRCVVGIVAVAG